VGQHQSRRQQAAGTLKAPLKAPSKKTRLRPRATASPLWQL